MSYIKYGCLFSLITALTGCMPYNFTEQPGVSGKTVDAETNAPVKNVTVRLERHLDNRDTTDNLISTTKTSEEGFFHIAPKKKWGIYIVPTDCFPVPYNLIYIKEKYITQSTTFSHGVGDKPGTVEIGTIKLKRKGN